MDIAIYIVVAIGVLITHCIAGAIAWGVLSKVGRYEDNGPRKKFIAMGYFAFVLVGMLIIIGSCIQLIDRIIGK